VALELLSKSGIANPRRSGRNVRRHITAGWPGNVRELRNTVRRAVLLSDGVIELQHLCQRGAPRAEPRVETHPVAVHEEPRDLGRGLHDIIQEAVVEFEKALIQHALAEAHNNKAKAAKMLHLGYKTLYRKLREYDML